MKTKRFLKKAIIILVAIMVIIPSVIGVSDLIYSYYLEKDDASLLQIYEARKEKCELLKSVPIDFIEVGKGINLNDIPDNIKYEIKNQNDGNIEFYYYIEQESNSDANPYKAWITLSQEYEVLEESYGDIELDDFESYKNQQNKNDRMYAILIVILITCATAYIIVGLKMIISILKRIKS